MTSLPASSTTHAQSLECLGIRRSTYGAGTGEAKQSAMHRLIGLKLTNPEFDVNSNHFSVKSAEIGFTRSSTDIEIVPVIFLASLQEKLKVTVK